jgi:hypothetical protein
MDRTQPSNLDRDFAAPREATDGQQRDERPTSRNDRFQTSHVALGQQLCVGLFSQKSGEQWTSGACSFLHHAECDRRNDERQRRTFVEQQAA